MASKVTIQDIADALGVSRNTVSKAINNTGVLADTTRDKVLKKAQEMGYKQFSYLNISDTGRLSPVSDTSRKGEIALFLGNFVGNSHFASTMLDKFQRELAQSGYSLAIYRVITEEIAGLLLPDAFDPDKTAGIACIEIFDHAYCRMLCNLNIPLLLIDSPANGFGRPFEADRLYMDNHTEIYRFISDMVRQGKKRIGFIGKYTHCHVYTGTSLSRRILSRGPRTRLFQPGTLSGIPQRTVSQHETSAGCISLRQRRHCPDRSAVPEKSGIFRPGGCLSVWF